MGRQYMVQNAILAIRVIAILVRDRYLYAPQTAYCVWQALLPVS